MEFYFESGKTGDWVQQLSLIIQSRALAVVSLDKFFIFQEWITWLLALLEKSLIYLFNRFHHDYNAKKDQGKNNTFEQDKNERRRCGTHKRVRLQIKCAFSLCLLIQCFLTFLESDKSVVKLMKDLLEIKVTFRSLIISILLSLLIKLLKGSGGSDPGPHLFWWLN